MGYKVLLADDSITIQKVIGIIFANEEYELSVVDNGNSALEKASEIRPDVILVDALMPGKSGYEVCREVRRNESLKDIPLLLLVGAFEPFDEEKARDSGADDHISKPFESQLLVEKVKKLIEIGEERAKARAMAATAAPAAAEPSHVLNLGGELASAPECGAGFSHAVAESGEAVGKSADVLCFDSLEIVEAAPEDDLWGVFEVEEIAEGEDVQLGEILEEEELQAEVVDSVEEVEPFVFMEDDSAPCGNEATISLGEYPETEAAANKSDAAFSSGKEREFEGFGGFGPAAEPTVETPKAEVAASELEENVEPHVSGLADVPLAELHATGAAPVQETFSPYPGREFESASREEAIPAPEVLGHGEQASSTAVTEETGTGAISLSEEQLAAIVSRLSKDIVEKIAWEVVPDLAETIIREEIRKIKGGY